MNNFLLCFRLSAGEPPVGTILSWIPKIDKSTGEVVDLPPGWQNCDGSDITEGPWTGGKTPDLNGRGLFLRGGDEDNVLETEESQLQDHQHVDKGHTHDCNAESKAGRHHHTYQRGKDTAEVKSNIGGVDDDGANAGDETRPANMRVIYIIRVI